MGFSEVVLDVLLTAREIVRDDETKPMAAANPEGISTGMWRYQGFCRGKPGGNPHPHHLYERGRSMGGRLDALLHTSRRNILFAYREER